jgi:GNAT superfamily N-acetyltransferase
MLEELKVRVGTPDDVDAIMDLALNACSENGFVNPVPARLLNDIWPALNRDHGLIGIIGEPGEKPEAAVLLRIGTMWYSDQQVVEEKAIFVDPNFRGAKSGRARRLIEFSKEVADTLGIPLIIGVLSNHRTEAKIRLYQRQFGKPTGAFFLYGASTGEAKGH